MKILLLNDNPVVNKLVTLSAQKSEDDLEIALDFDTLEGGNYDLLIVDDSVAASFPLEEVKKRVSFKKALFICSRDTDAPEGYSSTLKKPFLPTDLVELFALVDKEISEGDFEAERPLESTPEEEFDEAAFDEKVELESEALELDELESEIGAEDTELHLDDEEFSLDDEDLAFDDEEFSLDDEDLNLDDEELSFDDENESVLDDEEAQKVKELLDEAEQESQEDEALEFDMALDLEDEADADIGGEDTLNELESESEEDALEALESADEEELEEIIDEAVTEELEKEELKDDAELDFEMALDLEDEADADISSDEELLEELEESQKVESQDDTAFDEMIESSDEEELESFVDEALTQEMEEEKEIADSLDVDDLSMDELSSHIEEAVEDLSQEELESELDEDTLLEIAANDIDSLDGLSSKELKLALGEEVSEDDEIPEPAAFESSDESETETDTETISEKTTEDGAADNGVEKLKKLLELLSDKEVAATMKGMKISINIELGDA